MGVILQWRGDPGDRDDRTHETEVTVGRGRARCSGLLIHSGRVGPGVVVVARTGATEAALDLARRLHPAGFTVFVPTVDEDAPGAEIAVRRLEAAVEHLADNWHPRIGIVALGRAAAWGVDVASRHPVDALVSWRTASGNEGAGDEKAGDEEVSDEGLEPTHHVDTLFEEGSGEGGFDDLVDHLLYHLS